MHEAAVSQKGRGTHLDIPSSRDAEQTTRERRMVAVQTEQSPALGYLRGFQGDIFYPASPEKAGAGLRARNLANPPTFSRQARQG